MNKEQDDINREFENFSRRHGPAAIVPAEVISVNEDEATVHIKFSDDSEIDDARLKSVISDDAGIYALPSVGSTIQVARIENSDEYIVVAMDKVEKVVIKNDGSSLKEILNLIIEAVQKIMVMQGNNPDFIKLAQAKTKTNNLFN
jgi:hypothetical protein